MNVLIIYKIRKNTFIFNLIKNAEKLFLRDFRRKLL